MAKVNISLSNFSGMFDKEWKLAVETVKKVSLKATQSAFSELLQNIVMSTPVDTGYARGNWQTTIGSEPSGELDRLDLSGSEARADIRSTCMSYKFGDSLYFTNNAPYTELLEYGRSNQAPVGMVRINVLTFSSIVDRVAQRSKR
jgi:hypothetical protein